MKKEKCEDYSLNKFYLYNFMKRGIIKILHLHTILTSPVHLFSQHIFTFCQICARPYKERICKTSG